MGTMRIFAIIQARLSSNRLAGKVLRSVLGKPLLQYILEALKCCRDLDGLMVATSTEPVDDAISAFCASVGAPCFRGSLTDVAGRFRDLLGAHPCNAFVRANGDSPLLDHRLVSRGVRIFRDGDWDLVTNTWPRTFPPGQSVEVVRTATFMQTCPRFTEPDDREHVTRFFYRNPQGFRITNFESGRTWNDLHMAVDEPADFSLFDAVVHRMNKPHWDYSFEELVPLYFAARRQPAEAST